MSKIKKEKTNIKVFVVYHKKDKLYKNKYLFPIHVGRELFKNNPTNKISYKWFEDNMLGDNTGDNISIKNKYYNEMTAIYWIWKHYEEIGNPDFVGLNHYRRYFNLNYSNLENIIKKYNFICIGKLPFKGTISEQWHKTCEYGNFDYDGLDKLVEQYKIIYPQDFNQFNDYINSEVDGGFLNLFIMEKDTFIKYCEWIFSLLDNIEKIVSVNNRTVGMLAERLTSYYLFKLKQKNLKYLATSVSDRPPMFDISYICSKILNCKIQNYVGGKQHLIITIFGIRFSIKIRENKYA